MESNANFIPLDLIDDPRIAMRTTTKDDSIDELMEDMRSVGLIQAIVVRRAGDRYELIAGHRRTTAARLLGWATIKADVVEADDDKALAMRTIENLSRRDVDPVDEAVYIAEIRERTHKDARAIAESIHRSVEWVEARLAVFDMPDYLQTHLKNRKLSLGAALELSQIESENTRRYYSNYAALNGVSVATARQWRITVNAQKPLSDEERSQIIAQNPQYTEERKVVQCARCAKPCYLDRAVSVFVHPSDCSPDAPGPLE